MDTADCRIDGGTMKNKLAKYRAEREKNDQKIGDLQKRNAQLDELIQIEENQEIVDVYSCVKEIELYPGRFGGITVKIKLLLTYLSPERIDTKYYPPLHPQITAYGEMPEAVE